jgi:sulfopyruvate decarboxylase subunit beta
MLMSKRQALEILALHRADRIVIMTMSSTGIWPELSDTPLDFGYIPSSMGEVPPLGLGQALAQPERG